MSSASFLVLLHVRSGTRAGESLTPAEWPAAIGSHPDCAFAFSDPGVAPWHVHLSLEDGRLVAADYGTDAGTRVNGAPITTAVLTSGDVLAFGPVECTVEIRAIVPRLAAPAVVPRPTAARAPATARPRSSRAPSRRVEPAGSGALGWIIVLLLLAAAVAVYLFRDRWTAPPPAVTATPTPPAVAAEIPPPSPPPATPEEIPTPTPAGLPPDTDPPVALTAAKKQALQAARELMASLPDAPPGPAPAWKPAAGFRVISSRQAGGHAAAVRAAKPGDAVVFDSPSDGPIVVRQPIRDVQFLGGSAEWQVEADLTECAFLFHNLKSFQQTKGKIERTVFYRSSGPRMKFTHLDTVTFYYAGQYLWPAHNPDNQQTPQLQMEGFVRAVTIHKPITGLHGINRNFDMQWAPSFRLNATDPVGNGYGTYMISPIIWGQRAWTPYHVLRARGFTFAHVNTEYNIWADPILEIDQGIDCMILCTGVGSNQEANNVAYKHQPGRIKYAGGEELGHPHDAAPFRGAAFCLAGQRNRVAAQGNYKAWTIGRKQWLPGLHYATGIIAKDPFFQDWLGHALGLAANFSDFQNVTVFSKSGFSSFTSPQFEDYTYPLLGTNVIRPTLLPVPDLRAPLPGLTDKRQDSDAELVDLTGKSGDEIANFLDSQPENSQAWVYLGPGTYKFTRTLHRGRLFGAGLDRTILEWPADVDCLQRNVQGVRNLTIKGGRFGVNYQLGIGGSPVLDPSDFLRVRFDGQQETCLNLHATQNAVFQDCEFINAKNGFGWNLDPAGEWTGERGKGGLNIDKLDITNCLFRNLSGRGIDLRPHPQPNGQVAIHNCVFEDIGGEAIFLQGGQSHLVQNVTVRRAGKSGGSVALIDIGSRGSLAVSHVTIENEGVAGSHIGVRLRGTGVTSHVRVRGVETAFSTKSIHVLDHFDAPDGLLDTGAGSYVACSIFRNVNATDGVRIKNFDERFIDMTANAGIQPLDTTPPPPVTAVRTTRRDGVNVIEWEPVNDPESGVMEYAIFAGREEIGRTPVQYAPSANFHGPFEPMKKVTQFADPNRTAATYTVQAINGAGLQSDGKPARLRRWSPVRAVFYDHAGKEVGLQEIRVTGDRLEVTTTDGRVLDPDADFATKRDPGLIVLPPGPPSEPVPAR